MPVLLLPSGPKIGFCPDISAPINMKFSMGEHCLASFIKNVIDKFQHVCSCTVRLSGIIKQFGQVPTAISPPVNQTWVVQSESTALTGESQLLINYAENGCHKMHVT